MSDTEHSRSRRYRRRICSITGISWRAPQEHDCGIVYGLSSPYLLCVMTRGEDFKALSGTIREISHLVYQELNPS